jgi:MFS family permease
MKKFALSTIFLVVLVDLIGFGIVLPLLPFYAAEFGVSAVGVGFLYSIYSFAQLIFSPIWGAVSDRIGRRPVMLFSTFGAFCAYILFALSDSFWALFISRLLAGAMGGNISTAQAYVADVTTHEERAKGMGLIGAAFGIGFMAGPALASILIHPALAASFNNPYAVPGFFAAGLSLTSFVMIFFKLPETVRLSVNKDADRVVRTGVFTRKFWVSLREESAMSKRHLLPIFLMSIFLLSFGHSSLYSAFPLFCKTLLAMPPERVGLQFALMGLIAVFVQGGLIRFLVARFGESRLFLTGCVLLSIGMAMIPMANSEMTLALYLSLTVLGASLNGPTLNSMISKEAGPGMTGAVMGSSQGLSALGRAVGPAWGGLLFGLFPCAPFFATALLISTTVFFGIKIRRNS